MLLIATSWLKSLHLMSKTKKIINFDRRPFEIVHKINSGEIPQENENEKSRNEWSIVWYTFAHFILFLPRLQRTCLSICCYGSVHSEFLGLILICFHLHSLLFFISFEYIFLLFFIHLRVRFGSRMVLCVRFDLFCVKPRQKVWIYTTFYVENGETFWCWWWWCYWLTFINFRTI